MNRKIATTVGIYRATYTLTCHKDGSVTIRAPSIKWTGNTGTLAYTRYHVGRLCLISIIKTLFEAGELATEDGETMDALISGMY
jgi:hypothetical protein